MEGITEKIFSRASVKESHLSRKPNLSVLNWKAIKPRWTANSLRILLPLPVTVATIRIRPWIITKLSMTVWRQSRFHDRNLLNFHHYYRILKRPRKTSTEDWKNYRKILKSTPIQRKTKSTSVNSLASLIPLRWEEGSERIYKNMEIKTSFLQEASSSICHKNPPIYSVALIQNLISSMPAVLQEYMMLETIKRGIPRYNFLGIQGIFDGSDGVLRFKQNFNGYIVM